MYLLSLGPREGSYKVLNNTHIDIDSAKALAIATDDCWDAILQKDILAFGKAFRASFEAQIKMFPNMVDDTIMEMINLYKDRCKGYKLSGAGGGGYLILVNDTPIENTIKIKIRRKDSF